MNTAIRASLGIAVLAVSFSPLLRSDSRTLPVPAGCCKVRDSLNQPWKRTEDDLEKCKERNKTDNDNVLKESGLVWWDLNC